jgi:hypothetical protein
MKVHRHQTEMKGRPDRYKLVDTERGKLQQRDRAAEETHHAHARERKRLGHRTVECAPPGRGDAVRARRERRREHGRRVRAAGDGDGRRGGARRRAGVRGGADRELGRGGEHRARGGVEEEQEVVVRGRDVLEDDVERAGFGGGCGREEGSVCVVGVEGRKREVRAGRG